MECKISSDKKRPALALAEGEYGDVILCQITSKMPSSRTGRAPAESIELKANDFQEGGLKITSYARPRKVFTADLNLILYKIGRVKKEKIKEAEDAVCRIMKE